VTLSDADLRRVHERNQKRANPRDVPKIGDCLPKVTSTKCPQSTQRKRSVGKCVEPWESVEPWERDIPQRYRQWTLSDYPEVQADIREWMAGEQWSLLLAGGVGTRKTSLASAILQQWRKDHPAGRAKFSTIYHIEKFAKRFAEGAWYRQQCEDVDFLVLDDLGACRNTPFIIDEILRTLRPRYDQQARTVVTSNLNPDDIAREIDPRLADTLREGKILLTGQESKR